MAPTESELIKNLKAALGAEFVDCDLPRLVTIKGFLSPTDINGKKGWRVYLDHSLTRYYEFAETDVVHSVPTGSTEDDPQRIWVRQGVPTRLVTARSTHAEVAPRLLSGSIVQNYVQGQAPVYGPPQVVQPPPGGQGWWPGYPDEGDDGGWEQTGCKPPCFSHSP